MALSARSPRARSRAAPRGAARRTQFTLPELPYAYGALEPAISGRSWRSTTASTTTRTSRTSTRRTAAAATAGDAPAAVQGAIGFNGGGHLNHSIFWANLAPWRRAVDRRARGRDRRAAGRSRAAGADEREHGRNQGSGWGCSATTRRAAGSRSRRARTRTRSRRRPGSCRCSASTCGSTRITQYRTCGPTTSRRCGAP